MPQAIDPERDHFLWHLRELGIVRRQPDDSTLWDDLEGTEPVRVAIIDTGLDRNHPNLKAAISDSDVMDFSSYLGGTVYVPIDEPAPGEEAAGYHEHLNAISNDVLAKGQASIGQLEAELQKLGINLPAVAAAVPPAPGRNLPNTPFPEPSMVSNTSCPSLEDICQTYRDLRLNPTIHAMKDPSERFGSHATACAGLIGGRPPEEAREIDQILPYFGINPCCEIISICTPYSHEILPVIHALLFAIEREADIILMPRGVAHPDDRKQMSGNDEYGTRITSTDENRRLVAEDQARFGVLNCHQRVLEELLEKVSRCKYVILAAGNEGRPDALAYPASVIGTRRTSDIGQPSNGGGPNETRPIQFANGLLVATARNRNGAPSSYANGTEIPAKPEIFTALSDDSFRFDADKLRVDETGQYWDDFDTSPHHVAQTEPRSPWGLLSLDVHTRFGYEDGFSADAPEDRLSDRQSTYSVFGGTSAASAVLAGCISLAMQKGEIPRDAPVTPAELKQVFNALRIIL